MRCGITRRGSRKRGLDWPTAGVGFPDDSVVLFVLVLFAAAWRNNRKQIAESLARRANPTREEFFGLMGGDVSAEATQFLWTNAWATLQPSLTPHPDDDLSRELPIDSEEWSMDWPKAFADERGFDQSAYPDWPKDWPPTLRNLGKWLDAGFAGVQR
jgi:hypothetical protein